uniref:Uncharacterized protein n=1 Tax=Pyrodinium bahamense TaxID=73915 RepID=A0A7S0B1M8_9DINO
MRLKGRGRGSGWACRAAPVLGPAAAMEPPRGRSRSPPPAASRTPSCRRRELRDVLTLQQEPLLQFATPPRHVRAHLAKASGSSEAYSAKAADRALESSKVDLSRRIAECSLE